MGDPAQLYLKPALRSASFSCFSTADLIWVLAWLMTTPYLPLAPHLAHVMVSEALGFLGISNLELPHEHLIPTWLVVVVIAVSRYRVVQPNAVGVEEHGLVSFSEIGRTPGACSMTTTESRPADAQQGATGQQPR